MSDCSRHAFDVPDESKTKWVQRKTCHFKPDTCQTFFDEDDNDHMTNEMHADGGCYECSACGGMMMGGEDGWFDETPGKFGGWDYKPRFSFCPYCGSKVEM